MNKNRHGFQVLFAPCWHQAFSGFFFVLYIVHTHAGFLNMDVCWVSRKVLCHMASKKELQAFPKSNCRHSIYFCAIKATTPTYRDKAINKAAKGNSAFKMLSTAKQQPNPQTDTKTGAITSPDRKKKYIRSIRHIL